MHIRTPTVYIEKESKLDFIPGDNPARGVPCGSPTRGYLEWSPLPLQGARLSDFVCIKYQCYKASISRIIQQEWLLSSFQEDTDFFRTEDQLKPSQLITL